jgi:hypothetical protein
MFSQSLPPPAGLQAGSFGEERAQRVPIVVYAAVEEDSVNESLILILRFPHG